MAEVTRRTFHRNALGTLLTMAGGMLLVRALCVWSNNWPLLLLQVVAGTVLGAWVARRSYPELRVPDTAVAGGLAVMLVVGIGHMGHATPPLSELVAFALIAAASAGGTLFWLRGKAAPPAGRFLRVIHTGTIVWAATPATVAVLTPLTASDELVFVGIFVAGIAAQALVPAANVGIVVLGFLAGLVAPATSIIIVTDDLRHPQLAVLVLSLVAVVGSLVVALGAGLGSLVKHQRALSDVELVPPARIEPP